VQALNTLHNIQRPDLASLRALKNAPVAVKNVLEVLEMVFAVLNAHQPSKPKYVPKRILSPVKAFSSILPRPNIIPKGISDPNLLTKLGALNAYTIPDLISDEKYAEMRAFADGHPDLSVSSVQQASLVAAELWAWMQALMAYWAWVNQSEDRHHLVDLSLSLSLLESLEDQLMPYKQRATESYPQQYQWFAHMAGADELSI